MVLLRLPAAFSPYIAGISHTPRRHLKTRGQNIGACEFRKKQKYNVK